MELQVGVKAFLRNKQGKFLLLKRSTKIYSSVGREVWDIPGGRIEPGSSLIDNLKREISEETGLSLKKDPKLIFAQDILKVQGRHVVRLTYLGEIDGAPKKGIEEGTTDFRWATAKEMRSMADFDSFAKEAMAKNEQFFSD